MKKIKENINGITTCLLEIIIGILLLIDPAAFTSGIFIIFGIVALISGLSNAVAYFRTAPEAAAKEQTLAKGLTSLIVGAFCIFGHQSLVEFFPLLSVLYGAAILLTGVGKIQWTIDVLRLKKKRWFMPAISALVTLVFAFVILKNPFAATDTLWKFTAVALIVEAVLDIAALLMGREKNNADMSASEPMK